MKFCIFTRKFCNITEYSLINGKCRSVYRNTIGKFQYRSARCCCHRNFDIQSSTISRNCIFLYGCFSTTEVNALHEVKVGTDNLDSRTSTCRISIVTCCGWLNESEFNFYFLTICHHEAELAFGSCFRNGCHNNLIGSYADSFARQSVSIVKLYCCYQIHILTRDGQRSTSLYRSRSSYTVRRLNSFNHSSRYLYV